MKYITLSFAALSLVGAINIKNKDQIKAEAQNTAYWMELGSGFSYCGVGGAPLEIYGVTTGGLLQQWDDVTSFSTVPNIAGISKVKVDNSGTPWVLQGTTIKVPDVSLGQDEWVAWSTQCVKDFTPGLDTVKNGINGTSSGIEWIIDCTPVASGTWGIAYSIDDGETFTLTPPY